MTTIDFTSFSRRKISLIQQVEITECGLASIAMVGNYYGLNVDMATLRQRFQPSLRGASVRALVDISDRLGLACRPVKLELESLAALRLPAILHWDLNHYVVLEAVRRGKALIHDPAGRTHWLPITEVSDHFTGIALEVTPTSNFQPQETAPKLKLRQLWTSLTGFKHALLQTLILSIVLELFVVISPYYMQIALDTVVPSLDLDLLTVIAIGFGFFAVINTAATVLRSFVLLSAGTTLGLGIGVNVARRLLRLPTSWFEKRQIGDVLSRFQSVLPIRTFMAEGTVATAIDGSLAIVTFIVMVAYSPFLATFTLCSVFLYVLIRAVSFAAQRSAQREAIITAGREQSTLIESVRGIVTLRLLNRESTRLSEWHSKYVDSVNAQLSTSKIAIWQNAASTGILSLTGIITIWFSIRSVIVGGFSIGMVYAFLSYQGQFIQRTLALVEQVVTFKMLGLHLERISDIAMTDEDISFSTYNGEDDHFFGKIELVNVAFRYGTNDPFTIEDINLTVMPGEHVAITGASGGGKSTTAKIILGLLEPTRGQVLIDGKSLAKFGHKNFHKQIGAVLQDDQLFTGSLAYNIALFESSPDMDRVEEVARAVAIHEDIQAMPMGYESLVGDMGSALSSGQKQRILLARALYRRPNLLVLDEATSHLDTIREKKINETISNIGITRIIIAHREETIRAASKVYVLEGGRLADITNKYM